MAGTSNLSTLDPFATKPKEAKISPMARIGFFDEMGFEELVPNPEKLIADGGSFLKEAVGAIADLGKEVMPAKGSLEGFQNPEAAKEQQKKQEVAQHQKAVYSSLEEARNRAQNFAHERALNDAGRMMVAGMSNEEKNIKLKLNAHYKEEYKGAYHTQLLRTQVMEEMKAQEKAKQQQVEAEINPKGPDFDKNKANELGPTSIYNAAG